MRGPSLSLGAAMSHHDTSSASLSLRRKSAAMTDKTAPAVVRLFLLGLLPGFAGPMLAMPRMGLASHLQGRLNWALAWG
jgi:hypothetical protein